MNNRAIKPFERGGEKSSVEAPNTLRLVGYDVNFDKSQVLFSKDTFTEESFNDTFVVKSGSWYVNNGWVEGKNPEMNPGMIVSKDSFCGNVMVEITAKIVSPSTHDINVMINGEWDEEKDCRGNAYVAGLEAFWHGNIGFEKSPEYKLTVATQLFDFNPEEEYNFKLGHINGKVFVLVNDKLSLEITDPDPLDANKYGKIGFEAYSSWWKFKNLKVYKLDFDEIKEYYNPQF